MMKIAIIGYSGSGKSTLAATLGRRYGLPVLHLDTIHFSPGWVERPGADMLADCRAFCAAHPEGWVIDGNYIGCDYAERMEAADLIVSFQYNRFFCLYQVYKRYFTYRGRSRDSAAPGCPEKVDWAFFRWVLWDGRDRQRRDRYRWVQSTYPDKTVVLKNRRVLSRFLNTLDQSISGARPPR